MPKAPLPVLTQQQNYGLRKTRVTHIRGCNQQLPGERSVRAPPGCWQTEQHRRGENYRGDLRLPQPPDLSTGHVLTLHLRSPPRKAVVRSRDVAEAGQGRGRADGNAIFDHYHRRRYR